jgi:hypothetical protein
MKQRGTKQKIKQQKILHRIRQNNMNETVKEAKKKSKTKDKRKSQEEKKTGCTRREKPKGEIKGEVHCSRRVWSRRGLVETKEKKTERKKTRRNKDKGKFNTIPQHLCQVKTDANIQVFPFFVAFCCSLHGPKHCAHVTRTQKSALGKSQPV